MSERMGCLSLAKRMATMGVHAEEMLHLSTLSKESCRGRCFTDDVSPMMFHRSKGIAEWRCVETLTCPKMPLKPSGLRMTGVPMWQYKLGEFLYS